MVSIPLDALELDERIRILVTARNHGGIGGAERALYSICQALQPNRVDVVVKHRFGGPWASTPERVRLFTREHWRWVGAASAAGWKRHLSTRVLNPVRRRLSSGYDLHLAISGGPDVFDVADCPLRLLNPAGTTYSALPPAFQSFALESPDNLSMIPTGAAYTILPPPFISLSERSSAPRVDLPRDYLLTVFNPYWIVKGVDDLRRALESCPWPMVWCHSDTTVQFRVPDDLLKHPKLIHVVDPSPPELRHLYHACRAYVSFSRTEGFGWAIADALDLSPAVVSRPIGVLSFKEAPTSRVYLIEGEDWSFDWEILIGAGSQGTRHLDWLSPRAFRSRLARLLHSARDQERGRPRHSPITDDQH